MTDTLEITDAHRALAAYLRTRESEFGTMSDLAYDVISGAHKQAFIELMGTDNFSPYGASSSQHWTDAYRKVLDLVDGAPTPDVDWATADEGEPHRDAQAAALATMRRREAEALAQAASLTEQLVTRTEERDAQQRQYATLRGRVGDIADRLLEQAEERDWCSEYDAFVTDNGFEDLLHVRAKSGHVHVTITLNVDVDDTGDYSIDTEDVKNAILYGDGWDGSFDEGEVCED